MERSHQSLVVCVVLLLIGSICTISAAEKEPAKRVFSLVVRGGAGSFAVGDLNTSLGSMDEYYWWLRLAAPDDIAGEFTEVSGRFKDWEVEFQWAAWKGLSIGVALSGPVRLSDKSALSYLYDDTTSYLVQSGIRVAAPIKFSLYYSLPIFLNVKLVINGGVGLYHARMTQTYEWLHRYLNDTQNVGNYHFDVTGYEAGYHFGLGLEYKLNDRFSLMAEGRWRFAKIKSLKGSSALYSKLFYVQGDDFISSESDSQSGYLYHYLVADFAGFQQEELGVYADPTTIADEVTGLRKAFLDLSGFTFRIGLRIGLF